MGLARLCLGTSLVAAALCALPTAACTALQADCLQAPPLPRARPGFTAAAARVLPSVVTVFVSRPAMEAGEPDEGGRWVPMAGGAGTRAPALERSFSSGFVLSADGLLVSSAHAVAGAQEVAVRLADGRQFRAKVLGTDRRNDVALLAIAADGLVPVRASKRESVCAGDAVAALGSPFGFERSVTAGVVSVPSRLLPGMRGVPLIQTDVALNPGSSGGPMFDEGGTVVAMSTMVYSDSGVYMGVSFAVPVGRVLRAAGELRARQAVTGDIGMTTQPVTADLARAFGLPEPRGAVVTAVRSSGPAARAGLRIGDVVVSVKGRRAGDQADVEDAIAATAAGDRVELGVWREGALLDLLAHAADETGPAARAAGQGAVPAPDPRLGLVLAAAARSGAMPRGVYVDAVTGPGLLAGIEPGDRITAVNAVEVASPQDFDAALAQAHGADVVALLVWRESLPMFVAVRRLRP